MILVDTDVMVDVMRRHSPAVSWLDSLGSETIGIPPAPYHHAALVITRTTQYVLRAGSMGLDRYTD